MSLTEDYTFQLRDDGVVLNTDPALPFVDITRVIGLDSSPVRETMRQHEGQDGAFMDAEYEQGRHVVLEGDIYADPDGMEDFLDTLKANYEPLRQPVPLYLLSPGQAERVIFVKPLGVRYDWTTARRVSILESVQFLSFAEDPRIYTSAQNNVVIELGIQDPNGFAFDLGFDFGFGAPVVGNGEDAVNNGNRTSPPIFTITGPVVNPEIKNVTSGRTLRFELTLTDTQSLVIDPVNRTVLLDGAQNRRNALVQDQWFLLAAGTNFIQYRADSNDPSSTLTITYRDAWR